MQNERLAFLFSSHLENLIIVHPKQGAISRDRNNIFFLHSVGIFNEKDPTSASTGEFQPHFLLDKTKKFNSNHDDFLTEHQSRQYILVSSHTMLGSFSQHDKCTLPSLTLRLDRLPCKYMHSYVLYFYPFSLSNPKLPFVNSIDTGPVNRIKHVFKREKKDPLIPSCKSQFITKYLNEFLACL